MKNKSLIAIFLTALLLRLYNLGKLPLGFYEEEVTNAYVGRFILQTGRDLYGNWFPLLYFDKFGDFPPVLPMYLSGLSTFLFGLTEFAARFPTALIGALGVFPLFGLTQFFLKDKRASLFSAFLLAITPWHVVLSRTSAEGVIGFTVYVWALYLLFKKNRWSFFLFFLSYFLYPGLRIIIPLTILPFYKKFFRQTVFFILLTVFIAMTPWGKGRFVQTSVFHSQEVSDRIRSTLVALSYGEGPKNIWKARVFHNKVVGYTREFTRQYLSYVSPEHLFLKAGGQPRYFNVSEQGLVFVTMGILLVFALVRGAPGYIVYLVLITPIPAVLTVDFVPHAHRSLFLLLPILLLASAGYQMVRKIKFVPVGIVMLLLLEFVYFWHQYAIHADSHQSVLRNEQDKELAKYIIEEQEKYEKIIMPPFARLPIYYLFFSGNFDRSLIGQFQSQLQMKKLGKIDFFSDWCPTKYLKKEDVSASTLIVENGDCEGVSGYTQIYSLSRRDSTRAWRLVVPE